MRVLFDSLEKKLPIDELFQGLILFKKKKGKIYLKKKVKFIKTYFKKKKKGNEHDFVLCKRCKTKTGNIQKFLDLQLEIRNIRHISEAFSEYQKEELLNGENQYYCDQCKSKNDAIKGLKLKKLPDLLTLHLKRFEIDYTSYNLSHIKLNNEVIFPFKLKLNKYLQNKLEEEYLIDEIENKEEINENKEEEEEYHLNSILIHSGSITSGHYYAYIKSQEKNEEEENNEEKEEKWYEFNDRNVSKIKLKDIEKVYGGDNTNTNAYMLIYERKKPKSEIYKNYEEKEEIELIPKELIEEIRKENEKYFEEYKIWDLSQKEAEFRFIYNEKEYKRDFKKDMTLVDVIKRVSKEISIDEEKIKLRRIKKINNLILPGIKNYFKKKN
jgi:ubiquitin carboxyl-terminal hydrolase 47